MESDLRIRLAGRAVGAANDVIDGGFRHDADLVERRPSGEVRVTDHKTGKANGKPGLVIDGGKSLQPLLYALATEKLFVDEAVKAGRLYFCTSTGGFTEQVVPLDEQSRDTIYRVAETLGEAITQPFLPAAPEHGQCDVCDYRVVCGPHEERRTARKAQARLEPLLAMRALP